MFPDTAAIALFLSELNDLFSALGLPFVAVNVLAGSIDVEIEGPISAIDDADEEFEDGLDLPSFDALTFIGSAQGSSSGSATTTVAATTTSGPTTTSGSTTTVPTTTTAGPTYMRATQLVCFEEMEDHYVVGKAADMDACVDLIAAESVYCSPIFTFCNGFCACVRTTDVVNACNSEEEESEADEEEVPLLTYVLVTAADAENGYVELAPMTDCSEDEEDMYYSITNDASDCATNVASSAGCGSIFMYSESSMKCLCLAQGEACEMEFDEEETVGTSLAKLYISVEPSLSTPMNPMKPSAHVIEPKLEAEQKEATEPEKESEKSETPYGTYEAVAVGVVMLLVFFCMTVIMAPIKKPEREEVLLDQMHAPEIIAERIVEYDPIHIPHF